MKVLVTGGCGFIGTNFIKYLLTSREVSDVVDVKKVVNVDCQTYAGQGRNLEHLGLADNPNYKLMRVNICDRLEVDSIFREEKPDLVFNFAAESHVDRSIESADDFIMSNVVGLMNLLDVSKRVGGIERFIHVSTDEVYGSRTTGSFKEEDKLNPSSPYSSSKAAAELLALSYFRTHQTPVIITRSANNYGPYQFPEKLLPLFITNLLDGKKIPLMWSSENPGLNVRDWLHVEDNCRAIWQVSQKGQVGEAYNIPGENERTNVEITNIILGILGVGEEMIERVAHREGHDFRYAISGDKLRSIGYKPQHLDLQKGIEETVVWYKQNQKWWRPLKN